MCECKVKELEDTLSIKYGSILNEKEDQIRLLMTRIDEEYVIYMNYAKLSFKVLKLGVYMDFYLVF